MTACQPVIIILLDYSASGNKSEYEGGKLLRTSLLIAVGFWSISLYGGNVPSKSATGSSGTSASSGRSMASGKWVSWASVVPFGRT